MSAMEKLMKTVNLWIPDERQISLNKGHQFENYIANLFTLKSNYFSIAEWTTDHSDKRAGINGESDSKPDFIIRYKPSNEVWR